MIVEELNTDLAEDVWSSVPPEVSSFDDEAKEVEHYLQQFARSLERGNANAKDRLRAEWWLGRYLDGVVEPGGRRSREGTAGRFTGSKRSLPEWVTKQQKLRMSQVGKVDEDFIERYFTECEAEGDEITRKGLLDVWALHLEDQTDSIGDGKKDEETEGQDEGTEDEDQDDEGTDDQETDDDPPPPAPPRTLSLTFKLVFSAREVQTFDQNRKHILAVARAAARQAAHEAALAEIQRLIEGGK